MPNPRLADRYAKSLVDLAREKDQLEVVHTDMQYVVALCNASTELVSLLRSPIIKADQKMAILDALIKGKVGELTAAFIRLLVQKGREYDLPEMATAFINQYNSINGIHKVLLTTAVPVTDEIRNAITDRLKKEKGLEKIQLDTKTDESLIGGFVLEFNNNLVDASILRDLNDIRKQFSQNHYVHSIR